MATQQQPGKVPPATLPGTPSSFPIPPDQLIAKAQYILLETESGTKDPSVLADDFRFEFPVVSLSKKEFVKAVSGFKLKDAFPNLDSNTYDWRVDKYEPNRVWWTGRTTGTHSGELKFFKSSFKPTHKVVYGAPECMSYVFNDKGQVTSFTGGYVMDRRVGNTQGLGAMFGILAAIGGPVLKPGSPTYIALVVADKLKKFAMGWFHFCTLGLMKSKEE